MVGRATGQAHDRELHLSHHSNKKATEFKSWWQTSCVHIKFYT